MPDPLSVAGTAVGITSLGIQVCQVLVSYLQSIEGRSKTITEGLKEVQSLASIFHTLNDILSKLDQSQSAQAFTIRNCLKNSEEKLLEVQQHLLTLRGSLDDGVSKRKFKEFGRSLVYPFREGTLTSLRQSLQALLNDLSVSINVVSLESGISHYDKLEYIQTAVKDIKISGKNTNDALYDLRDRIRENAVQLQSVECQIDKTLTQLGAQMDQTEWIIKDIGHNVNAKLTVMQSKMQSDSAINTAIAAELLEQMRAQTTHMEAQSRMMSTMMQKQDAQFGYSRAKEDATRGSDKHHEPQPSCFPSGSRMSGLAVYKSPNPRKGLETYQPMCNCDRRGQTLKLTYTLGNIKFQYEQEAPAPHSRGCKYYGINSKTVRVLRTQFPTMMGWLSSRLTLGCLDFTYGSGNLGASITYRNIVQNSLIEPELHRLIQYVDNFEDNGLCDTEIIQRFVQRIQSTERAVLSLYRDKKASPSDRDVSGRSSVDMLVGVIAGELPGRVEPGAREKLFHPDVIAACVGFIQTLQNACHADDSKAVRTYPLLALLDRVVDATSTFGVLTFLSYLIESFEVNILSAWSFTMERGKINAFSHLSKLFSEMKGLDVSALPRAIFEQSLEDMEKCITADPDSLFEQHESFTCFEMAVGWPEGLQRLLQAKASLIEQSPKKSNYSATSTRLIPQLDYSELADYSYAVRHAILMDCHASVDMLMRKDNFLDFDIASTMIQSRECARIIASNLAQRRRRLLHLAELKVKDFRRPPSFYSLDRMAAPICELLRDAEVFIPPNLYVARDYTTIYDTGMFPIYFYDILLESGFYDFKSYNHIGLTPVMMHRSREKRPIISDRETVASLNWLEDQGCFDQTVASLNWLEDEGCFNQKPIRSRFLRPNTSAYGWHYFAISLGFSMDFTDDLRLLVKWLLRSQASITDKCICWCNHQKGCSPFESFIKALIAQAIELSFFGAFEDYYDLLDGHRESFIQFIRTITFEALDMTHTCCYEIFWPVFGKEQSLLIDCSCVKLQDVRSNKFEKDNANLLCDLMGDFADRIEHLDLAAGSVESFIWGYWRYRISKEFRVDSEVMEELKLLGGHTQTHVLPDRVLRLLGDHFTLLTDDELDAIGPVWDTESEEETEAEWETMSESGEDLDESEGSDESEAVVSNEIESENENGILDARENIESSMEGTNPIRSPECTS